MDTTEERSHEEPTADNHDDVSGNESEISNDGGQSDETLSYEDMVDSLRLGEDQPVEELPPGDEHSDIAEEEAETFEQQQEREEAPVDEDEPEEPDGEEVRKPSRYRFSGLDDVEHRAMELRKRNADLSLSECIDIAKGELLPDQDDEEEYSNDIDEVGELESDSIKAEISELRGKYDEFMDDYDVDEAKKVSGQIETLRDQLQEVIIDERFAVENAQAHNRQNEDAYNVDLKESWDEAAATYEGFGDPNSQLSILAEKLAAANSLKDTRYDSATNKPMLAAQEAATLLGIRPNQGSPTPQQKAPSLSGKPPFLPARGSANTTKSIPQNKLDTMIDSVSSTEEFDDLMESLGV